MKNLPIGINTLQKIDENNMIYIDKTEIAHKLIQNAGAYFLSRPRRFGKSLFVDTLKEIFEGNKELFKGLFIYDNWNWDKKYPVIKVDFAGGVIRNRAELDLVLTEKLHALQKKFDLTITAQSVQGMFIEMIHNLNKKFNLKVVVLIDEYDKPLLDNIERPEMIAEIRDGLKNFYSVLKEQDANLQFVFLTGVSKFSKVNIFSGINNLNDITLDEKFASVCGYTHNDLQTSFSEHLAGVDWDELKKWYNGYNFLGEKVYNPFDILLFIQKGKVFRNYWFETGTPTFLIKLFQKNEYFLPELDNIVVGEEILSSFEIDKIEPVTLLFQTGYLTIKETFIEMNRLFFKIGFPNFEVKTSFNEYLISGYTDLTVAKLQYERSSYDALIRGDLPALEKTIKRLFAAIPYRNFTNNNLLESEGYYASVLYAFFAAINCDIIPEDITNHGQADMTVMLGDNIYIMEITLIPNEVSDGNENSALRQIQEMNYAEKYRGITGKNVFELGIIFSKAQRNVVQFDFISL
ncbi:MAG: hypothetical protein A2015_12275 [Spirochaetes bacterium GWF1_31_7]|nr:MAG: hypothetical protein A2Y30_10220 [Spirochaetes bacterium GWE1_32_154]OHD51759.1 MAG: hypothetical protein A2015_12275 [Spirochaetes bacterium GWF1_31_7]OHD80671.1 MAG: hypothetical protein A2355_17875 [Spirochaetes bacterium RIFOXYB1_FULL_32_8]HBD94101.1 hypothetical protein [Spirochaetia bacterium]HBI39295.1 hypothetical protein [Spirochaetia bacterium]